MSAALDIIQHGEIELPAHGPGRALGQKRRPQLKLSMGYRDPARSGAPVKTSYFIPRGTSGPGDDNAEEDRVVAKFKKVYGDQPRAVDIRLPGTLDGFLDIQHIAFAKSKSGQAYLRAAGYRNFAADGRLGGADMLTVYEYGGEDGLRVTENVPITGLDDPTAAELGLTLTMTVSFGIPNVLGLGGLCQVTTRGKESIDTLYENACDIYGTLGSFASVALRPKLLLKPSTMLTPRGQKTPLYVLDLYLPESMDEVYDRLERHHQLVPARGAAATVELFGGGARALGEGSEGDTGHVSPPQAREIGEPTAPPGGVVPSPSDRSADGDTPAPSSAAGQHPGAAAGRAPEAAASTASGAAANPSDDVYEPVEGEIMFEGEEPDVSPFQPPANLTEQQQTIDVAEAAAARFPTGKYAGQSLVDVAQTPAGRHYLEWAAKDWRSPAGFVEALQVFVAGLDS